MKCLNQLVISGRLVEDPTLSYTKNRIPVVSFRIAVDRNMPVKEGEKPETDFFSCCAWRGTAEFIGKYFRKGRVIILAGRIEKRKWKDENGVQRTSAEIVANDAFFGDSAKQQSEARPQETASSSFATPESAANRNASPAANAQNAQAYQAGGNYAVHEPQSPQPNRTPAPPAPAPAEAINELPEFVPVSGSAGTTLPNGSFVVTEDEDVEYDF